MKVLFLYRYGILGGVYTNYSTDYVIYQNQIILRFIADSEAITE